MRLVLLPAAAGIVASLLASPAQGQKVTRGPYLQFGTPDSIVIVWRTDVATESRVDFAASGAPSKTVTEATPKTQHEVKLSGLSPNTSYSYSVGTTAKILVGPDASYTFRTPAPIGSTQKFRAWILGDSGLGNDSQRRVRDAMLRTTAVFGRPQVWLHMGDIAYFSGTDAEFQTNHFDVYDTISRNTVCWPTIGNHEAVNSKSSTQTGPYFDAYVLPKKAEVGGVASGTEAYYSFDYHNVHFVVLDAMDTTRTPGSPMLTWLQADLAATKQPWIIAYFHAPPYSKGSRDSDVEGEMTEMRGYVLPILEAAGVDVVLAGHSHVYERSYLIDGAYETPTVATGKIKDQGDGKPLGSGPYKKPAGITSRNGAVYVVAGHGGYSNTLSAKGVHPVMYFSEAKHGSCLLDVERNTLTLQNLRDDGKVTDTFTLVKGDALIITQPNGADVLDAGTSTEIRWTTVGTVAQVELDYSLDGGATWKAITTGPVANTGKQSWVVPTASTNNALVRVRSGTLVDESNTTFNIGTPAEGPTLEAVGDKQVAEGQTLAFTLVASHPRKVALTFSMAGSNLPTEATLDSKTGAFSWATAKGQGGVYAVTFTATDDVGRRSSQTATLRVGGGGNRDGGVADRGGRPDSTSAGDGGTVSKDKGCCSVAGDTDGLAAALLTMLLAASVRLALRRRRRLG